jgi:hypothetical protein
MFDRSGAAGLNVTEYVAAATQEYDAVTGWVRFIPFELVVRNLNFRSDRDVRPTTQFVKPVIGSYRVGLAVVREHRGLPWLTRTRRRPLAFGDPKPFRGRPPVLRAGPERSVVATGGPPP